MYSSLIIAQSRLKELETALQHLAREIAEQDRWSGLEWFSISSVPINWRVIVKNGVCVTTASWNGCEFLEEYYVPCTAHPPTKAQPGFWKEWTWLPGARPSEDNQERCKKMALKIISPEVS